MRRRSPSPINDHIDYDGAIVTWIDNINGDRPYGNDLDPTLNLDVLEVSFRNLARWKILETPAAARSVARHRQVPEEPRRQRRLRRAALSHLLSAGTLFRLFRPLLRGLHGAAVRSAAAIDPDGAFEFIRERVLAYVQDELITTR